ncbi:DUF2203 family protein [Gammaproteobacteria bacterium]|nr:DUF2203 family protein [Gammaproteobacteria bacterium]
MADTPSNSSIVAIGYQPGGRIFTMEEAKALLPTLLRLTAQAARDAAPYREQLARMLPDDPQVTRISQQLQPILERWKQQVESLGLVTYGLWRVGFETGRGYFAWEYPEGRLAWWVREGQAFEFKQPLHVIIDTESPDWAY